MDSNTNNFSIFQDAEEARRKTLIEQATKEAAQPRPFAVSQEDETQAMAECAANAVVAERTQAAKDAIGLSFRKSGALGLDPAKRDDAVALASRMGITDGRVIDQIHANYDVYEAAEQKKQEAYFFQNNSALQKMDATERDNLIKSVPSMSAKDLYNLNYNLHYYGQADMPANAIGRIANKAATSFRRGRETYETNEAAFDLMRNGDIPFEEKRKRAAMFKAAADTMIPPDDNFAESILTTGLESAWYSLKVMAPQTAGAVIGSAATYFSAGTGAAVAPVAVGAGMLEGFRRSFKNETGAMFVELATVKDAKGNEIPEDDIRFASYLYGFVSAGIESLASTAMLKLTGVTTVAKKALLKNKITNALKEKTVKTLAKELGVDFLVEIASEGTEEALQQAAQSFIGNRYKRKAEEKGVGYFDLETPSEIWDNVKQAAAGGAKGAILLGVGGAAVGAGVRNRERVRNNALARLAKSDDMVGALYAENARSVVAEKAAGLPDIKEKPAKYDGFLYQATKGTALEQNVLTVEDAEAFLQSEAVANNRAALEQNGVLGDLKEKIERAKETGGTVNISEDKLLSRIAPYIDVFKEINGRIRLSDGAMSANEARAIINRNKEIVETAAKLKEQRNTDFETALRVFENAVAGAQNVPAEQKRYQAELYAASAVRFSQETKLPVSEVLRRMNLTVSTDWTGAVGENATMRDLARRVVEEARANAADGLISEVQKYANKDVNALARVLKENIKSLADNPQALAKTAQAITNKRLNLEKATPEDFLEVLTAGDAQADNAANAPAKAAERTQKSDGRRSANEKALADIQQDGGDYIVVGGGRIGVSYEIAELSDVKASNSPDGAVNADFPAYLQPRDRSDVASREQIQNMTANFTPERVGRSPTATEGAPVLTRDGYVLAGNGRAMTIGNVYRNAGKAQIYKDYLTREGFDIGGFKEPVLVRRLTSDLSDEQLSALVDDANTTGTMTYSVSETALKDCAKITKNLLEALDGTAELSDAANRNFVKGFFETVIPGSERNALMQNGQITKDGIERIENALAAMIVPDKKLLDTLLTQDASGYNQNRKIASGISKSAPAVLSFENDISAGRIDAAYSVIGDLNGAAYVLKRAVAAKKPISVYIKQLDMLEEPIAPAVQYLSLLFEAQPSALAFKNKMDDYIRLARTEGDMLQDSLFAAPKKTKFEIFDAIAGQDALARDEKLYQSGYQKSFGELSAKISKIDADRLAFERKDINPELSGRENEIVEPIVINRKFSGKESSGDISKKDVIDAIDERKDGKNENEKRVLRNSRTGETAALSNKNIGEMFEKARSRKGGNIGGILGKECIANIANIFDSAFLIKTHNDSKHGSKNKIRRYANVILSKKDDKSNTEAFIVKITVKELNQGRKELTDIEIEKNGGKDLAAYALSVGKKKTAVNALGNFVMDESKTSGGSDINIGDLIDFVNTFTDDEIEINGELRKTHNSDGQRIAKTEEGLRAFYEWFGDSKVVDEQGRPLIVYHGTKKTFDAFDEEKISKNHKKLYYGKGFYFTKDYYTAQNYGKKIMPVYLKISNPSWSDLDLKEGSDGIFGTRGTYVVFEPEQIKSVENIGSFSKETQNIYYQSAYAGSRVDYDQPSIEAIGSGEGNQAHGWGLYYALNKDVAEQYRRSFVTGQIAFDDKIVQRKASSIYIDGELIDNDSAEGIAIYSKWFRTDKEAAEYLGSLRKTNVKRLIEAKKNGDKNDVADFERVVARLAEAAEIIKSGRITDARDTAGQVHEVDIPENPYLLDEQKPFSKQSAFVKKALRKLFRDMGKDLTEEMKTGYVNGNPTGAALYSDIISRLDGTQKAASELLAKYGVKGITYEGLADGRCFVIFDDKDVKVIQKFYQNVGEQYAPRGMYDPARNAITLFSGADFSTLIHESGHYWLTMLRYFAGLDSASAALKSDAATVEAWLSSQAHKQYDIRNQNDGTIALVLKNGTVEADGLTTAAHAEEVARQECFARAMEKYFMTAQKPPVARLGRIFQAFKRWLKSVYKNADELNVDISDEVRTVFSRLFATEAEIEQFARESAFTSALDDYAEIGEGDKNALMDMFRDVFADSSDDYAKAKAAVLYEENEKERARREREVRRRLLIQIQSDKRFLAVSALVYGKIGDADIQIALNNDARAEIFGDGANAPRRKNGTPLFTADGLSLSEFAQAVGIDEQTAKSAVAHIHEFVKRFEETVSAEVDRTAGKQKSVAELENEARDAMATDKTLGFLLLELSVLQNKATGGRDTKADMMTLMKEYSEGKPVEELRGKLAAKFNETSLSEVLRFDATEQIGKMIIGRLNPESFFKDAQRAGEAVLRRVAMGKNDEAVKAKIEQIKNFYLYKEARDVQKRYESTEKRLRQIGNQLTNNDVEQSHQDAARALLIRYGLARASGKAEQERVIRFLAGKARETAIIEDEHNIGLADWIRDANARGEEIPLPESLLLNIYGAKYSALSVSDFFTLADTVKSIVHNGREVKALEIEGKRIERDAAIGEMVAEVGKQRLIKKNPHPQNKKLSYEAGRLLRSLDGSLTTMNGLCDRLDNGNTNGAFHTYLNRPLSQAEHVENELRERYILKFGDLVKNKLPKESRKAFRKEVAGSGAVFNRLNDFTREELICIGLNMGAVENLDRLKSQTCNNFTNEMLDYVKDTLTTEEWDFIQSVWDLLDGMFPMLAEHHKNMSGLDVEKVVAAPFTAHGKEYKGGYYPLAYASDSVSKSKKQESVANALLEAGAARPFTNKGYTKSRMESVNKKEGLKFDFTVIANHLATTIHDVAYRRTLRDLWATFNDPRMIEAFTDNMGEEYHAVILELLRGLGNKAYREAKDIDGWERLFRFTRQQTTMIGLCYRISTILTQPVGFLNGVAKMQEEHIKMHGTKTGAYWAAVGAKKVLDKTERERAFAMSAELRARQGSIDFSTGMRLKELRGENGILAEAEAVGYKAMGMLDYWTATALWIGAYHQALDMKMSGDDAVYFADKVMTTSQGAGNYKDAAPIQRKGEAYKALTTFYSFFSGLYQMSFAFAHDAADAVRTRDKALLMNVLARFLTMYAISTVLNSIIGCDLPDEDESWLHWLLMRIWGYQLSTVPVARDLFSGYSSKGASPTMRLLDNVKNGIAGALDSDKDAGKRTKAVLKAFSSVVPHLPVGGQFGDSIGYLVDKGMGNIGSQSWLEVLYGLYKGREFKQ